MQKDPSRARHDHPARLRRHAGFCTDPRPPLSGRDRPRTLVRVSQKPEPALAHRCRAGRTCDRLLCASTRAPRANLRWPASLPPLGSTVLPARSGPLAANAQSGIRVNPSIRTSSALISRSVSARAPSGGFRLDERVGAVRRSSWCPADRIRERLLCTAVQRYRGDGIAFGSRGLADDRIFKEIVKGKSTSVNTRFVGSPLAMFPEREQRRLRMIAQ